MFKLTLTNLTRQQNFRSIRKFIKKLDIGKLDKLIPLKNNLNQIDIYLTPFNNKDSNLASQIFTNSNKEVYIFERNSIWSVKTFKFQDKNNNIPISEIPDYDKDVNPYLLKK